jgi:sporulation protein YlmC with PRC-barrel domain
MNSPMQPGREIPPGEERIYRFSELRGLRVRWSSGDVVGRSCDLLMTLVGDDLVTRLLVIRSRREFETHLLPWAAVVRITSGSIEADVTSRATVVPTASYSGLPVRIGRDVLRRKIVDREGGRVGVVHDARFVMQGRELALLDLDISVIAGIAGLLRLRSRMRPGRPVPWSTIDPQSVGYRRGPLLLRATRVDLDTSSHQHPNG